MVVFVVYVALFLVNLAWGTSLPDFQKRIISGEQANAEDFPWLVIIQLEGLPDEPCGGAIIGDDMILTAAHCFEIVNSIEKITVTVGMADRNNLASNQKVYKVKKIVTHHEYHKDWDGERNNDIAVVQVDTKISMNKAVQSIQLPKKGDPKISNGTVCTYAGWGTLFFNASGPKNLQWPRFPQKEDVPIVDDDECFRRYLYEYFAIVKSYNMVCTGGSAAPCEGDSGLPLMCKEEGQWVLRGVGSWSRGGCKPSEYSIFTRVSFFVDWIKKIQSD